MLVEATGFDTLLKPPKSNEKAYTAPDIRSRAAKTTPSINGIFDDFFGKATRWGDGVADGRDAATGAALDAGSDAIGIAAGCG